MTIDTIAALTIERDILAEALAADAPPCQITGACPFKPPHTPDACKEDHFKGCWIQYAVAGREDLEACCP